MWNFFNSSEYTKTAILIIITGIAILVLIYIIFKKYF